MHFVDLEQCSNAVFGDTSPEHLAELGDGHAVMAVFDRPRGGTVVNVGVTDWVLGLHDSPVERITRNVLDSRADERALDTMRTCGGTRSSEHAPRSASLLTRDSNAINWSCSARSAATARRA